MIPEICSYLGLVWIPLERLELLGFGCPFLMFFLTCSFFHQRRSPLHLSFNLSSLSFSLSSVLSNLWKSLNLCLKLYLICSSSTASLSEFIQMDKEEDAFDISAVPGGCSRSLAKSYKREVILGRVWISMHRFGLVYSHCVFETCLNICYWCMNNTAIYNSFFGQENCPVPPGKAVCLHGSCIHFGSLQGQNKSKKSPSSITFSRWGGVFELCYLARQSPLQNSLCQLTRPGKPEARLLGELSPFPLPSPSVASSNKCEVLLSVKTCHPAWYPYFCYLLEKLSPSPWSPNVWFT